MGSTVPVPFVEDVATPDLQGPVVFLDTGAEIDQRTGLLLQNIPRRGSLGIGDVEEAVGLVLIVDSTTNIAFQITQREIVLSVDEATPWRSARERLTLEVGQTCERVKVEIIPLHPALGVADTTGELQGRRRARDNRKFEALNVRFRHVHESRQRTEDQVVKRAEDLLVLVVVVENRAVQLQPAIKQSALGADFIGGKLFLPRRFQLNEGTGVHRREHACLIAAANVGVEQRILNRLEVDTRAERYVIFVQLVRETGRKRIIGRCRPRRAATERPDIDTRGRHRR